MEKEIRAVNYIGHHECHDCPANNDPSDGKRACPDWWEWEEEQQAVEGMPPKKKMVAQCGRAVSHTWMYQVLNNNLFATTNMVNTANRVEEAAEDVKTAFQFIERDKSMMMTVLSTISNNLKQIAAPKKEKNITGAFTRFLPRALKSGG